MRRLAIVALAAGVLLAGAMVGVGLGQTGSQVETLQLRTEDLVLQTKGFGESQSETPTGVSITLAADVLFRFNSAQLSARAQSILAGVAAEIHQQASGPRYTSTGTPIPREPRATTSGSRSVGPTRSSGRSPRPARSSSFAGTVRRTRWHQTRTPTGPTTPQGVPRTGGSPSGSPDDDRDRAASVLAD